MKTGGGTRALTTKPMLRSATALCVKENMKNEIQRIKDVHLFNSNERRETTQYFTLGNIRKNCPHDKDSLKVAPPRGALK